MPRCAGITKRGARCTRTWSTADPRLQRAAWYCVQHDHQRPGSCSKCGHTYGARCTVCKREFMCGALAVPCPNPGCSEKRCPDEYDGFDQLDGFELLEPPEAD